MFMLTSAPPSRAATVMARESLENSLPRLASSLPFLCLMVAHLECPDTRTPPPFSAVVGRRGCGAAQLAGGARLLRADRLGRRALPGADLADEQLVQTGVIGQLGVKGGHQDAALTGGDDVPLAGRQDVDFRPGALDPRRTDEHGAQRGRAQALDAQVLLEAAYLTPERVAARDDVHDAERRRRTLYGGAGDGNEARAGAVDGAAAAARLSSPAARGC